MLRTIAWVILTSIILTFLGILGIAAFAQGTLEAQASRGGPQSEIVMSFPIWLQLLTPLLTIIGCVVATSIGVGQNREILRRHTQDIERILTTKVDKELCNERHGR